MNCRYITLFFNRVAGIVQTFIKSWNQFLYPRVIEVCRLPFEPRHHLFLRLIIVVELRKCGENAMFHLQSQWSPETHLLPVRNAWETSFRFVIVNILGTQRAHNFLYPNFSVTASWIEVLDTSGMTWCNSQSPAFGGLWIGAANSYTSHPNKAGSTTVKRARFIKGSRSTAVLPQ
jgi:hypothetical protein